MSRERKVDLSEATPIEKIFEKVAGRKMTLKEKIWFHLEPDINPAPQNGTHRAASRKSGSSKLTRN